MITIQEVESMGFGNPDSKLSYKKSVEHKEYPEGLLERGAEIIISGECMVDITESDDGCIDGRPAVSVAFVNGTDFKVNPIDGNGALHERPKVAGGGYITALFSYFADGEASEKVEKDLSNVIDILTHKGIYCGIHTGCHGHNDTTDCGGNDYMSEIVQNILSFRDSIA